MFVFYLLCIANFVSTSLITERYETAKIWILRTHSIGQLNDAYNETFTTDETCHITQDVGDFCPRLIAKEYDDALVISAINFLGFAPVIVSTGYDASTTKFVATDVMQVDFIMNITTAFNFSTLQYDIIQQGFLMREYITFLPNSSKMLRGYTIQDPAVIKAFGKSSFPREIICQLVIFPACNVSKPGGGTYLSDTGFATLNECNQFMANLAPIDPCPFAQRSNTSDCRTLHGISAFLLPEVHCAHVKANSMVCTDSCLPACNNCDVNAKCVAAYPSIPLNFTPVYSCKCNNGYVGNGTSCTPKTCNYGNCPALHGSYECSTGLCMCTETFTHNPVGFGTNNLCTCSEGRIIQNNSKPVCVPPGRCLKDQWECTDQVYNRIKCDSYGYNTFTLFKSCLCNYGFSGNFQYPCVCDPSKRIVWSNVFNGEVCLASNECTIDWHCTYPKHCTFVPGQQIGKCN